MREPDLPLLEVNLPHRSVVRQREHGVGLLPQELHEERGRRLVDEPAFHRGGGAAYVAGFHQRIAQARDFERLGEIGLRGEPRHQLRVRLLVDPAHDDER